MTCRKLTALTLGLLVSGLFIGMPFAVADPSAEAELLHVGMAKTFFNDIPPIIISIVTEPFNELMKKTTGLEGQLNTSYDPLVVAQKLQTNQLQLGVFHGHEFAWVQQKYPELRPILVVVNKYHDVRAFLVTKKDSAVKSMADLRGKKLALPMGTKQHCRAYLERHCTDNALSDPTSFFSTIVKSISPEAALDDVCRGKIDGTVVDTLSLEFYKEIKGPCFENNLIVAQQSDYFPPAVIVYKQGVLDQDTLIKFRDGLIKSHDTTVGRDMMKMWKIQAFELIPDHYERRLLDTLKAYPIPEAYKVSLR